MPTYPNIVSTIIAKTEVDSDDTRILALIPDFNPETTEEGSHRNNGQIAIPHELLPDGFEIRKLSADVGFVDEAVAAVQETATTHLFVVPPFIGGRFLPKDWRTDHWPLGLPEVLLERLLAHGEGSESTLRTCIALLPHSSTHSISSGRWRSSFFPEHSATIIEHPMPTEVGPNPFGSSAVVLTTVVFQMEAGPVRFFRWDGESGDRSSAELIEDLGKLLTRQGGKTEFGYVYRGILEEGYPCTYDFYSEETARLRKEVGAMGEKVELQEVADVKTGFHPTSTRRAGSGTPQSNFQYIDGRCITDDGRVDLADLRTREEPADNVVFLEDGDWCIRQIFRQDPSRGFVVGVYEGDGRNIAFSNHVIVVRPKPTLSPAQRTVLFSFLRSPLAASLSDAKGMSSMLKDHVRVSVQMLREYPVPLADEELTTALEHLSEARAAFRKWESDCATAESSIWLKSDAVKSRQGILAAGRLARQRYRAGRQTERLDFRIRTQFPHPLAHLWRQMEVASTNPFMTFRDVLRAAEGYACFLALSGLIMAKLAGKEVSYLKVMANRLNARAGGTSFGDWVTILVELNTSRNFRNLDATLPFLEISQLFGFEGVESALRELKSQRDDQAHDRISAARIGDEEVAEAREKLSTLYSAAEFLTDYTFVYLLSAQIDSLRGVNSFKYRDLSGDNPLAPIHSGTSSRNDLETESLYWIDRQGELHLLRPFLHYLECPECHSMSTFFLDTYPGSGNSVGLKSLERGSQRTEPIADNLRQMGLLPLPEDS